MSLWFPYRAVRVQRPIISLGNRRERPRPLIPVTLIGPAATVVTAGLLDTGADDTLFPESIAVALGIDLRRAALRAGSGVGRVQFPLRYASVVCRIADRHERREWQAVVAFSQAASKYPLLGYAGFLQFFDATFHGSSRQVELAVNASYRGT